LVRLSDIHGSDAGQWFLEAGFGGLKDKVPKFMDLGAAIQWISEICVDLMHPEHPAIVSEKR
jgi:hypothetical protein